MPIFNKTEKSWKKGVFGNKNGPKTVTFIFRFWKRCPKTGGVFDPRKSHVFDFLTIFDSLFSHFFPFLSTFVRQIVFEKGRKMTTYDFSKLKKNGDFYLPRSFGTFGFQKPSKTGPKRGPKSAKNDPFLAIFGTFWVIFGPFSEKTLNFHKKP